MRRVITLAAFALLLACCPRPTGSGSQLRDLQAGFELSVPAGWQIENHFGEIHLLLTRVEAEQADRSVRISLTWDRPLDGAAPTLDEYLAFRLPRMGRFASVHRIENRQRTQLGAQAITSERIEQRYTVGAGHEVQSRAWLMSNAKGSYMLTFAAPPDQFEQLASTWAEVEKSFRLLP